MKRMAGLKDFLVHEAENARSTPKNYKRGSSQQISKSTFGQEEECNN